MDNSWITRAIAVLVIALFILTIFKFRLDEEARVARRICTAEPWVWDDAVFCRNRHP